MEKAENSTGYPDGNPKTAIGVTKVPFHAIPFTALVPLGLAMMDGKKKYGLYNFRLKGVTASVYLDAAMRHLLSWWDGEDVATDSKIDHLGHVMACCAILIDAKAQGMLNDDRGEPGCLGIILDEYFKNNRPAPLGPLSPLNRTPVEQFNLPYDN